MDHTIPVILITGFLGSGKTTLLNRLLADGVKTAVVINEFGAMPIDQDLLANQDLPLTVLSGGCLCCRVKGALAPTLKNLRMAWEQAESKPFERVIIEASGIASPEPILDTLLRERWLSSRYSLQTVITTLAIPAAIEQLDSFSEARAQVIWADSLLLTHADLAGPDQRIAIEKRLQDLAPATPRYDVLHGAYPGEALIAHSSRVFRHLPDGDPAPTHNFQSLSLYLDQPLPWPQLQAMLLELLADQPTNLLRIKGVVYLPDAAEPIAIQAAANRLYPPTPLPRRNTDDRRSRLVFISNGNLDKLTEAVNRVFAGRLAKNAIRLH